MCVKKYFSVTVQCYKVPNKNIYLFDIRNRTIVCDLSVIVSNKVLAVERLPLRLQENSIEN